jgi:hypothetical protein
MTYPIDATGTSSGNAIAGEVHPVNNPGLNVARFLFPTEAPFFESGVTIQYTDQAGGTRQLIKGVDYTFVFEMKGVSSSSSNSIFAAIRLLDSSISGSLELAYQTLGGNWTINQAQVMQYLRDTTFNSQIAYAAIAPLPDLIYPGQSQPWILNSLESVLLFQSTYPNPTIGIKYLPLPANKVILSQGDLIETAAGTQLLPGGSGGGGGGTISGTVVIEGGNLNPVLVNGSVTATLANQSSMAQEATLVAVLNAVKATSVLTSTVWVDRTVNPPVYYLRKETYQETTGTTAVSWETPSGASVTPPSISSLVSMAYDEHSDVTNTQYLATQAGTGYSINDLLLHSFGVDAAVVPPVLAYAFWLNVTTGQILTTPPASNTIIYSGLATNTPTNYSLESGGNLAAVATATGTQTDSVYNGTGSASIISALKGVFSRLGTVLNTRALTSGSDSITAVISGTPNVAVTSTVLPSNAAQESGGNLAAINAVQGTVNDAPYAGGASATVISALRGIYAASKGTISIRALSSSTDSVTTVPSGTQAVSVAQLPTALGTQDSAHSVSMTIANDQAPIDVTSTGGALALDTTVATQTAAINALQSLSTSVFFDHTATPPTQYIRRETNTHGTAVVSWTTIDGTGATPNLSNLTASTPYASAPLSAQYTALTGGTGYSTGDILINSWTVDQLQSPPVISASFWLNATTNSILASAPTAGTYALATGGGSSGGSTAGLALAVNQPALNADGGALSHVTNFPTTQSVTFPSAQHTIVDNLPSTQTVSGTVTANVGTTGGLALDASIQTLITAVQATVSLASSVWEDPTTSPPTYYVRREEETATGTTSVHWEHPDGTSATPPSVSSLLPCDSAAARALATETIIFEATGSGTGYNSGDMLAHSFALDTSVSPAAVAYSFWFNLGPSLVGTLTAPPTGGTYVQMIQPITVSALPLPANAAQETGGNLAALSAATGSISDAPYSSGSGTMVALLKGVFTRLAGPLNTRALSSSTDTVKVEGGNTTAVKTDGSAVTQPISAAALPLPSGAAQESGNLATVATGVGDPADVAYAGSGSSSMIAALKGIYAVVKGTLSIRALTAATDTVTVQGGNSLAVKTDGSATTQPVSAVSLPLPTGAAQESGGNLATLATVQGARTDTAYAGSGNATTISGLKGLYNLLAGTLSIRALTSVTDTVKVEGGNATAVKTDGSAVTQPVSAAALPLPSNAAQETGGNLASLNTATGVPAATAYAGTGSASVISGLKGIYNLLAGTLSIRSLTAATDTVTVQGGNTVAVKTDGSAVVQPVSATALPLPTGAATESGNLATISTKTTLSAAADGTPADAAYAGSGTATIISALKGLYAQLAGTIATRFLSSTTDSVTIQGGNSVAVKTDGSATTQPVSGTVTANVGTTGGLALDSSIQTLNNTIKATIGMTGTVWADHSTEPPTYYVRRESINEGTGIITVVWENPDGTTATPTLTNLTPASADASLQAESVVYSATGSGTGYSSGDILVHSFAVDNALSTPRLAYSFWFNAGPSVANGTILSVAPTNGTYSLQTTPVSAVSLPLPSNAAQETGGNLTAVSGATGTTADAAYAGSGTSTIIAGLKGIYAAIKGTISIRALTAATDTVTIQGGNTVAVKTDGSAVTQPISAAALPLPAGAAQESGGNLAGINTATGTQADVAYAGSGSASIVSTLKGIYAAVKGTLTIRALTAATDTVTIQGGNSTAVKTDGSAVVQPISATALPLPTGAAVESGGHLAAIDATTGTTADASYSGSGSGTVITLLKGVYAKLAGTLNTRLLSSATDSVTIQGGNSTAVKTDGSAVTQPISASALPLPANAAIESGGHLAAIDTTQGATADVAYAGSGASTTIAGLKGIYAAIKGTLSIRALTAATDTVTIQGGNSTAVKTDGSATTQPISASALPLPSNAASETGGNLAAISTATGAQADVAYTGSGSTSIIAGLKGIYSAIKGTISIRALSSGTDSVTTVPSGTQAISAVSLPLPSGAAQESGGNLATIATQTTSTATAMGNGATGITMPTGGAGLQGWLSGIYNKLNTSIAVTGTFFQATQPVSAVSLPLPSNAAQETGGNLATTATQATTTATQTTNLNTVTGTTGDTAWVGSGSGTLNAILKAIYGKLAGSIAVTGTFWQSTQPISAASLPLPTGAATESGHLATIDISTAAVSTATGAVADAAYAGSGNTTIIAGLKGIYAAIKGTLSIRALTSGTDSVTAVINGTPSVTVSGTAATSSTQLPGALGQNTMANSLTVAIASNQSAVPVSSSGGALALDASIQTLINTVKATIGLDGTVWVDDTVNPSVYYIRRETVNEGTGAYTVVWENPDGTAATPTVSHLTAVGDVQNIITKSQDYIATGSGTGYSSNDILTHTYGIDSSLATPTVVYSIWFNITTGAVLTVAPTGGTYSASSSSTVTVSSSALPENAAQETGGNLASIATSSTAISTATGTTGDSAWVSGAGTIVALLKNIATKLAGSVAVTGTFWQATQPISAASLPLPTGAALETGGNLATTATQTTTTATQVTQLNSVQGAKADAAWSGTGNSTQIAALKAIYLGIVGTLNIRALTAADVVTIQGGNSTAVKTDGSAVTQPISAAALPLPSGAATEAGHLATIDSVQGAIADAAYVSGSGTVVSILKGIFGKLSGSLAVTGTFWQATQPVSAASLPLPTNAAQETGGNLAAILTQDTTTATQSTTTATQTTAINAATGTTADAVYAGSGSATVVGILKGIYAAVNGTLAIRALTSGTDSVTIVPSGTQAISAASLPLPTGAATESGHLATIDTSTAAINTATGAQADAAYAGSGSTSIIGALKGIYAKLTSGIAVTGTFWQATQPVSAASLPLPTGAAIETGGNLATTATKVTSIDTVQGAVADAAWSGTGSGTVVAILKAVYAKVAGTLVVSSTQLPAALGTTTASASMSVTPASDAWVNTVTGAITAANTNPSGVATAGSAVEITTNGAGALTILAASLTATTLILQGTTDGTTWITFDNTATGTGFRNLYTSVYSGTITVDGEYEATIAGYSKVRVTSTSGSAATITLCTSLTPKLVSIGSSLPQGGNNIGAVNVQSSGTAISSLGDGAGLTGLLVGLGTTDFVASALNSTTVQLATTATFTGTVESVYNHQAISVLLTTDQPGTLTLTQYIDAGGTRVSSTVSVAIVAGTPYSRSWIANGNYFKATFQNTGGSTTTTLNLNIAYGILQPATSSGNLPTALQEVNGKTLSLGNTSNANSLPVTQSVETASGSITAVNANLTGAATAGSAVEILLNGAGSLGIGVSAISSTTLVVQVTTNGTFWQTLGGTQLVNVNTNLSVASMTTTGDYTTNVAGAYKARVCSTAGTSATVSLVATESLSQVILSGSLPAGTANIGTVTQQALTKGTQGANGVSTQNLKDAGRNQTNYFMAAAIITTATDTLQSLTGYKSGAAVGATTTPAVVTAGKTYRITRIVATYTAIATAGYFLLKLRANTGGVVAIGSPLVDTWEVGAATSAAGATLTTTIAIPDGMEFSAGTGIGISVIGMSATGVATAVGYAQVSIGGFEY